MNYAVMHEFAVDTKSSQFKAPFNQINNMHHVATYEDTAIVTPNSDTPYSILWLDLRAEPMVISVPAVEKERYYSVQLIDGNTYNFGYIGSRATGNEPGSISSSDPTGRARSPPASSKVFYLDHSVRVRHLPDPALQSPKTCRTWRRCRPATRCSRCRPSSSNPRRQPRRRSTSSRPPRQGSRTNFFEYLDAALEFVPPTAEDKDIRAKLARIGVGPGKTFDFKDLSAGTQSRRSCLGMKEGDDKVAKFAGERNARIINGWSVGSFFGDRAFYKGDWLKRAAAAKAGLYGNDAVEAMYPFTRTDATGETLDGSKHNYTHHLSRRAAPAGELPSGR